MRKIFTLLFFTGALLSTRGYSQDIFIKIATIEGESTQVGHKNEIGVYSYSHGIVSCVPTNTGGGGGNGACKVTVTPLALLIKFDKSNIALKNAILMGTHLPFADMVFLKTGGDAKPYAYYKMHMEDVTVTSLQESGSEGSSGPSLSMEVSFTKVAWQYTQQSTDGGAGTKSTVGWDISSNKPWSYSFPQ